jgi:hypothetical protein
MNQQKITSFFSADKSKQLAKPAKKQEEPFWEPLFYNRKKAFNIVSNLTEIKRECEESYKEKALDAIKRK